MTKGVLLSYNIPVTQKKLKAVGSVKIEPLKGQFFDIKPSPLGKQPKKFVKSMDFIRFVLIAFLAFLILNLYNTYTLGRELVFESQKTAQGGYENLKNGMDHLMLRDSAGATQFFREAENTFVALRKNTAYLTSQADHSFGESFYFDTANKLIEGAIEVTQIGQRLAGLMNGLTDLPKALVSVVSGSDSKLTSVLKEKKAALDEVMSLTVSLQQKLTTLNDSLLPANLRDKLDSARSKITLLLTTLQEANNGFELALGLLGDKTPQRYLVLLQNNQELRATGGFIGSYLLVDVNDGQITKMESKDVYQTDGQLADVVKAPPGIDRVAKRLYMRDANYSPDFPTSARQIMWFLEHSKGPSVDGVIAIDQTVVEKLLELAGPVSLPNTTLKLTPQNFSKLISFYTEAKISDSVTPKQLLFDFIPMLRQKLKKLDDLKKLLPVGLDLIQQGHVQVYSEDADVESIIARFGLDGSMTKPDKKPDYLSVITTAIGGNKSDQYIHTKLLHRSVVMKDGSVEDSVSIQKTHNFSEDDKKGIQKLIDRFGVGKLTKETLFFILGQGPNLDYMRVYVPLGSKLASAEGIGLSSIAVSEDLGYTVFGFIHGPIAPGESKEITLHYSLPSSLSLSPQYNFFAEHQAGAENMTLKKELEWPGSTSPKVLETAFDKNQSFSAEAGGK